MDGSDWYNAYPELAYPLKLAGSGASCHGIKEIWVAEGTYSPQYVAGTGISDPDRTFIMVAGVKLYGGFKHDESSPEGREIITTAQGIVQMKYKTVLSGDIDDNTSVADNVYHVVIAAGDMAANGITACLDGFTLTGGNAIQGNSNNVNSYSISRSCGGGLYIHDASPVIAFDSIAGNSVTTSGAGVYVSCPLSTVSKPVFTNTYISSNTSTGSGGGVSIDAIATPSPGSKPSPSFTRTVISGNKAATQGGGVYISGSPQFTNTLVSGNVSASGGGVYVYYSSNYPYLVPTPVFTNVTIAGNFGTGNTHNGGLYNNSSSSQFRNTLVWGNTPDLSNVQFPGVTSPFLMVESAHKLLYSKEQIFVAPEPATAGNPETGGDYRLRPGSPAIDLGDRSVYEDPEFSGVTVDMANSPRIVGCDIDFGAYESAETAVKIKPENGTVHVKKGGKGKMDGSDWDNAYPELAYPLLLAASKTASCYGIREIWVAEGTYSPQDVAGTGTSDPDRTFMMVAGIKLYGGFKHDESSPEERETITTAQGIVQMKYKSVLSGYIGENLYNNNPYNVYHVV
jgi:hypothetical protein